MHSKALFIINLSALLLGACHTVASPQVTDTESFSKAASNQADFTGLEIISSKSDTLGFTHNKYRQIYQGIPIWASELIIHIRSDNSIYRIDGPFKSTPKDFSTQHVVSVVNAVSYAKAALQAPQSWKVLESLKTIFISRQQAQLAWQIKLINGPLQRDILIDATSGKLIKKIKTSATQVNQQ